MKRIKTAFKKLPDHIQFALLLIIPSVVFYAVFGLLFGSIIFLFNTHDTYIHTVWTSMVGCYLYFGGAALSVSGLLNLLLGTPTSGIPIGFGPGLYYGTILLAEFLREFITTLESNLYVISFVIVALICYIIWLKHFKPKFENNDK